MKIDSVALSDIPELMHDFLQDSRGQSFGELEESWQKVVTEPDADEDEIDSLFNREEDSWESYLDYYDGWVNPAYEQAGPPSTFDLGFKHLAMKITILVSSMISRQGILSAG